MKEANNQKLYKAVNVLSVLVTVFSLGHFAALELSIQHAQTLDDLAPPQKPEFNVQQNIPFAISLALLGVLQLASALVILVQNLQKSTTKTAYYCSIIGMICAFAIGVQMTILAQEYNFITRSYPKNSDLMPQLMPLYYTIQLEGTVSLMLSFPMMAFIFYHKLGKELQRDENKLTTQDLRDRKKAPFYLWIFAINALALLALIFLTYRMSSAQNQLNYTLNNQIDQYFYFLAMGIDSTIIAIVLQAKNIQSQFINKRLVIVIAFVVMLYQAGTLFLLAIKTAQLFIRLNFIQNDPILSDREQAEIYRWQILGYNAINLIVLFCQIPYLKLLTQTAERQELRDTLITNDEIVKDEKEQKQ